MSRTLIVRSATLTVKAKTVFGDLIVAGAYFSSSYDETYESLEDKIEELKKIAASHVTDTNGDVISLEAENITIELTNGRFIEFSTSEWADIQNVTERIYEIETE